MHRLLREDEEVRRAVIEHFGGQILDEAGQIDRSRLGEIVFRDRNELEWLEGLLHPRVAAESLAWREELGERADPPALCVTEVPLLYEVGGETRFDAVVAITAPADVRATRSRTPLTGREERLLSDDEKLGRADFAFVNDGSLAELSAFVRSVVDQLTRGR